LNTRVEAYFPEPGDLRRCRFRSTTVDHGRIEAMAALKIHSSKRGNPPLRISRFPALVNCIGELRSLGGAVAYDHAETLFDAGERLARTHGGAMA
jgi:hypothetical protein